MAPFASNLGGGSAIQRAMARRGLGGATGSVQVSPAAAGFSPGLTPPPSPTPTTNAAPAPAPAPVMTAMGNTAANPEAQLIIKALSARLDSLSKMGT